MLFFNEMSCIFIKITLKCVPKGQIDNKWALIQVKCWRRTAITWTNDLVHWRIYAALEGDEVTVAFVYLLSIWLEQKWLKQINIEYIETMILHDYYINPHLLATLMISTRVTQTG